MATTYTFICRKAGASWDAKMKEDSEKSASAADMSALKAECKTIATELAAGETLREWHTTIMSGSICIAQYAYGGNAGGGGCDAAPAAGGAAAPAAAAAAAPEPEEEEEEEEDMGFDLFD
ncbi:hypothetical protein CYMTET_25914 [Cymbomonas tetramitiformis]|uniref:60S acidic ribosomal protein P3 n=1 Tax=Cymbomonas tetramitiformis TaxID=36881 RepID=A0AAE0KYD7_9CHLO|nr:hypothetical protein CYMTET_25914 [Cymbomonas tetramitiformis]